MAHELIMPKLGMAMTQGEVVKWLVSDGERVNSGQPVVQVMSKKITYQINAPEAGTVQQVAPPKSQCPVTAVLGYILLSGEDPIPGTQTPQRDAPAVPPADTTATTPSDEGFVLATPMAKRIARDHGVSLSSVTGTGPRGRVQEQDVLAYLETAQPHASTATSPSPDLGDRVVPWEGMRSAIADRMVESVQHSAQLTLATEVDVTALWESRANMTGTPPGFTSLIAVAVAQTLPRYPRLNALIFDDGIHLRSPVNLGIAVALDEGLMVPVVHQAETLSVPRMDAEIVRLSALARQGGLSVDDVSHATFTITNLGMYGIDTFTPIINSPEVAILGVGRVVEKPALLGGVVVPRRFITLSLTIDHRAVDGAPAAQFLQHLNRRLTFPGLLWMEERGSHE